MRLPALMIIPLLAGCGYKQETFAQDYATATCLLYDQCAILETYAGFASVQECQADLKTKVNPEAGRCPEYERDLADDCVNAINQTTCDQFIDGHWPQACTKVCPDGAAQVGAFREDEDESGGAGDTGT